VARSEKDARAQRAGCRRRTIGTSRGRDPTPGNRDPLARRWAAAIHTRARGRKLATGGLEGGVIMAIPEHLEEAADRLKEASYRLDDARAKPATLESLREWLEALTTYTTALGDIHQATNESVHEKLNAITWKLDQRGSV
jgi:hypothetical protein